jgi:predicted anti-sigma-YlaC factor YlaD
MRDRPATTDELTCQELVELVTDFLEGRLSSEHRRRFEEHLVACEPCRRYVEQMRITVRLVGRLREEDLEPRVVGALLVAFRDWRVR